MRIETVLSSCRLLLKNSYLKLCSIFVIAILTQHHVRRPLALKLTLWLSQINIVRVTFRKRHHTKLIILAHIAFTVKLSLHIKIPLRLALKVSYTRSFANLLAFLCSNQRFIFDGSL